MATEQYMYNGKLWRPRATVSDKNSFFHATCGERADEGEAYFDKHANVKRMRWVTFLTYFENEAMPDPLKDVLVECFSANNKYKHSSIQDTNDFNSYKHDIIAGQCVAKQEIPILSALENIKIVLLSNEGPVVTVNPNPQILGNYPNTSENVKDVVLCIQENSYLRLESVGEVVEIEVVKQHVQQPSSCLLKYYKKRGSAGIKGAEFQVRLLTVLLLNARMKLQDWELSTEDIKADKFDDAVVEWPGGTFLIQAKHKEKEYKITLQDFLSTNSKNNFSLSKYFFSYSEIKYKFKENKTLAICTNSGIHDDVLKYLDSQKICPENILYCADKDYSFYMFNMKILDSLKQCAKKYFEKNYKNINRNKTVISDKNLEDFLKRLHIYSNYSLGNNAEEIIQKPISIFKCYRGIIQAPIFFSEIYSKIMEWFKREEGIYLTEAVTDTMLLEIKSDQYWKKLGAYDVSFKENLFDLQHKRLYYVKAEGGYLLQELKIYQTLKNTQSKILYANTDSGIEFQKKIIEAIQMPFYNILIICWPRDIEETVMREMCDKLREILDQFKDKKIILVAENNDNLLQYIGLDESVYAVVNGSVSFQDFSSDSQTVLLETNVNVQGKDIMLQELLETQTNINKLTSGILEKLVRGEQINVGQKIEPLPEQLNGYYIDRIFVRDEIDGRKMVSEEEMCDREDKVILIADEAGKGKSTVLSHLAFIIKNKNPSQLVIRIGLSDYTEILYEFKEQKKFINIIELLDSKQSTSLSNQLEKELFSMERKIVILMDGVDEISPDYTENVVRLLEECQQGSNFAKVFLTARPHMTQELAWRLKIDTFTLLPFNEDDQIRFLTNYWMHNLKLDVTHKEKCKEYANTLIRTTYFNYWMHYIKLDVTHEEKCKEYANTLIRTESCWIRGYERNPKKRKIHFAAIPLLARMLAEIFQSNDGSEESMHWEGCKEYVLKGVLSKLPEIINMTKIYQKFIEKKRDIYKRKGSSNANPAANKALDDQFEKCLAVHRKLAIAEILPKSGQDYQQAISSVETDILKIGIVQISKNSFHFVHRTFAEYFFAESLIGELKRQVCNENQKFQKFFFDEILLKAEFKVVRAFFDYFLKDILDKLPFNIFKSYQSLKYDVDVAGNYRLIHDLAAEGCTSILRLLFKCVEFKVVKDKKINLNCLPIYRRRDKYVCENTLDILNSIMQQGGVNIFDKFNETPLTYALRGGHLEMVTFLIQKGANLNSDEFMDGPLWYAITSYRLDMVKIIVQHGADLKIKNSQGHTILYQTIRYENNVNIVEYLLDNTLKCNGGDEMGSIIPYTFAYLGRLNRLKDLFKEGLDVNSTVENQETLIFGAARGGQLDTIKHLVNEGADINATDADGNTILHVTITKMSTIYISQVKISRLVEAVQFLIELGSDVNTKNNSGQTILHSAAIYCPMDIVKYLVTDLGIDVNVTDNYGCTPLHYVNFNLRYVDPSTDHLDAIAYGGNLDITNDNGMTALHTAAELGPSDIIECFIKLGADVNARNNNGSTALHIAASLQLGGEIKIAKRFVELGADVNLEDNEGRTALHYFAPNDKRDILKILLNGDMDNNTGENEKNGE